MDGLHSPAPEREAVLAGLRGLLLHVARHEAAAGMDRCASAALTVRTLTVTTWPGKPPRMP